MKKTRWFVLAAFLLLVGITAYGAEMESRNTGSRDTGNDIIASRSESEEEAEEESFRFVGGRLQLLERGVPNIEPGTLDQIIELREDGRISFTALKMTFYCEKTTGGETE